MDGTFGVVPLCVRIAEIHQNAIAHELGDKAVEATDGFTDHFLIGADHVAHFFRVKLRGQARRIREVAEHHRQLTPLGARQVSRHGWSAW